MIGTAFTPDRLAGRRPPRRAPAPSRDAPREPGGTSTAVPRRRLAVLTCMDCRVDPLAALGLAQGDAHVIRNAGARATGDAVRSLAQSQHLLGTTSVVVLGHTDCRALLVPGDPDASVRDTVRTLRGAAGLPHRRGIRGAVVDVTSGRVRDLVTGGEHPRRPS